MHYSKKLSKFNNPYSIKAKCLSLVANTILPIGFETQSLIRSLINSNFCLILLSVAFFCLNRHASAGIDDISYKKFREDRKPKYRY